MDKYYSQTIGTPIMTMGGPTGRKIVEVVIEPETGRIIGFLVTPRGEFVATPRDILYWNQRVIINDVEDIVEVDDIIKIKEILARKISVYKNRVFTQSGTYLGEVLDYAVNPKFFVLTKLLVAKTVFGLFPFQEKIIAHRDILEIKKDRIIVKDRFGVVPTREPKTAKGKLQIDIAPSV